MLADTKQELISHNKTVESVSARLRSIGSLSREQRKYHRFITKLSHPQHKPSSLEELFNDLNEYCRACFEYGILEFIMKANKCSTSLENRMDEYVEDMQRFKENTPISAFIRYGKKFFKKRSSPKKHKSTLRTIHDINPETPLSYLDSFQDDVCMKLPDCPMQVDYIKFGSNSIETEWIIPEEFDYDLIALLCSDDGLELLERHQVNAVYINDVLIDSSVSYVRLIHQHNGT